MTRLKYACYTTNLSISVVSTLSPLLFVTFRSLYGISYSLLGLLVLVYFLAQLFIDLVFSFFSHKFNIPLSVKITPLLSAAGLLLYAVWPWIFPGYVYPGLMAGTLLFSMSNGFTEVLISPVIAAIPSEDPDREMSKLHSVYAWGVVFVVLFSTVYLLVFGSENWQYLPLLLIAIPLLSFYLYYGVRIPDMATPEKVSGTFRYLKNKWLWICVAAIFLGGAAECTMSQWCSGYLEQALKIPKLWGDIFGVAVFSMMLGMGRTLYAKIGKRLSPVLLAGSIGAAVCYLVAAVSPWPILGLLACGLTGLCTSMLWPGNLIVASDQLPDGGVFIYALMAVGGDFGAAVGPQLVGVVTDTAMASPVLANAAAALQLTSEQLGMKLGMLVGMLFPLASIPVFFSIWRSRRKTENIQ